MELDPQILKDDRRHCRRFGPCGVGNKALYLNSFYISRMYYLPIASVKRIYKRVAMSKGGFTGKGLFASIPYLVVEYEDGQEKQCNFKVEEMVDQLIAYFHKQWPDIPVHSAAAQKKLEEKQRELAKKQAMLESSKARDIQERTNPAYRWVALAIVLMGGVSFGYGIYALVHHLGSAMYFLLFGLAAVFLFSGANVLPTRRNNAAYVQRMLENAWRDMERYTEKYPDFPIPACYAHPVVLRWMQEILAQERAGDTKEALAVLKKDLQALNSSVTVEQETYDEVMMIKPLFLVKNYE